MSKRIYDALFTDQPDPDQEVEVTPLLRTFARAAATRRAAQQLAGDELLEGNHMEDEAQTEQAPARLAAKDASPEPHLPAAYAAGEHQVRIWMEPSGAVLVQHIAGPAGVTLELDGRWLPLQPGQAVEVGTLAEAPPHIVLHDAAGRRWKLPRE